MKDDDDLRAIAAEAQLSDEVAQKLVDANQRRKTASPKGHGAPAQDSSAVASF